MVTLSKERESKLVYWSFDLKIFDTSLIIERKNLSETEGIDEARKLTSMNVGRIGP
jgi:hypothetical protein